MNRFIPLLTWLSVQDLCWLTKAETEMKREHWTKRWNWSSCTKLWLRVSWTHGLIAQSVRASEWNSVVVGSNQTQANFLCTGFSTDVTWVNTKVDSFTQLFSGADESVKDKTHLLLLWVGSLAALSTFVFTHVTSVVKPLHIFMAKSRVCKSCLKADFCFHRYVHFSCVLIYIFSFDQKQCASD